MDALLRSVAAQNCALRIGGQFLGGQSGSDQVKGFWSQVSVPTEHLPILVAGNDGYLLNLKSSLEQAAGPLVTKVVKMEVQYTEAFAGSCECRAGRSVIEREDAKVTVRSRGALTFDQRDGIETGDR